MTTERVTVVLSKNDGTCFSTIVTKIGAMFAIPESLHFVNKVATQ